MDPELTNWKCGIDVIWGTGNGADKGTAYYEEYPYFDKRIYDIKTVYLRGDTPITMSHNIRNIATLAGRNKVIIGSGFGFSGYGGGSVGTTGLGWTGGGGIIRLKCDQLWSNKAYTTINNAPYFPAYTGTFTLNNLEYTTGVMVVGTTGGTTGWSNSSDMSNQHSSTGFYWRGLVDSFGDEWHILTYADDDSTLGNPSDDACVSDGKSVYIVVNPKTPCLTVRASGSGQFYTTPPHVYLTPKIHQPQTTYFIGDVGAEVTFELRDIYQNPIIYRINSGFWQTGASSVMLSYSDFNIGQNILDYYYFGNQTYTKSRILFRNPTFPSSGELHGNLFWLDSTGWDIVTGRLNKAPYASIYASFATENKNRQGRWNALRYSGLRLGGYTSPSNTIEQFEYPPAQINAFMAKMTNFTGKRAGFQESYAEYAKQMLIENVCNVLPIGFELNQASQAIPSQEYNYRGYWDAQWFFRASFAYDIIIANYKSSQFSKGITPIEDYFVRDQLASINHLSALWMGSWVGGDQPMEPGMWGGSRAVVALVNTLLMSDYSTPYYGTCGLNGNTKVYPWAPYATGNFTWESLFINGDYSTGKYPYMPVWRNGLPVRNDGNWGDKMAYASYAQVGQWLALYANLQKNYYPLKNIDDYKYFFWKGANGSVTGTKDNPPSFQHQCYAPIMNSNFPEVVINGLSWMKFAPFSQESSLASSLPDSDVLGLIYYDDLADTKIGQINSRITPRTSASYSRKTTI